MPRRATTERQRYPARMKIGRASLAAALCAALTACTATAHHRDTTPTTTRHAPHTLDGGACPAGVLDVTPTRDGLAVRVHLRGYDFVTVLARDTAGRDAGHASAKIAAGDDSAKLALNTRGTVATVSLASVGRIGGMCSTFYA